MLKQHLLEDLIDSYLSEKDITHGSKELYQTILKQYIRYLKERGILYATSKDVKDFLDISKVKGSSTHWMYNQITVLKGLYQYLSQYQKHLDLPHVYSHNIMSTIKNVRPKRTKQKRTLTAEEAKQLLLFLKNTRKHSWQYRDYALIYLMITTGLRSVETRRAKIKDLKTMHGKRVLYVHGKGRSFADEFVKLSSGVTEALDEYLAVRKDQNPHLFASRAKKSKKPLSRGIFNAIMKRVLQGAGVLHTNITAHSLRHTAATFNLKRGGSLEETKRLLRHTSMDNTLLYTDQTDIPKENTVSALEDFILQESSKNT